MISRRILQKCIIGIVGGTVLLIGVAFLALPGPGWLTIFVGLAILAVEFAFAKRLLERVRDKANTTATRWRVHRRIRRFLRLER